MEQDRIKIRLEPLRDREKVRNDNFVLDLKSVPIEPRLTPESQTKGYFVEWQLESVGS